PPLLPSFSRLACRFFFSARLCMSIRDLSSVSNLQDLYILGYAFLEGSSFCCKSLVMSIRALSVEFISRGSHCLSIVGASLTSGLVLVELSQCQLSMRQYREVVALLSISAVSF